MYLLDFSLVVLFSCTRFGACARLRFYDAFYPEVNVPNIALYAQCVCCVVEHTHTHTITYITHTCSTWGATMRARAPHCRSRNLKQPSNLSSLRGAEHFKADLNAHTSANTSSDVLWNKFAVWMCTITMVISCVHGNRWRNCYELEPMSDALSLYVMPSLHTGASTHSQLDRNSLILALWYLLKVKIRKTYQYLMAETRMAHFS